MQNIGRWTQMWVSGKDFKSQILWEPPKLKLKKNVSFLFLRKQIKSGEILMTLIELIRRWIKVLST